MAERMWMVVDVLCPARLATVAIVVAHPATAAVPLVLLQTLPVAWGNAILIDREI
jgi:hypothetical protein